MTVSETSRLEALKGLELMLTPPEERFDRITRLAREVFDVPIAEINLIGESTQFTKSPQPAGANPVSERSQSFCDVTIQSPDTLVVRDATLDARFAERTTVTGERHIRFYAGRPLSVGDGVRVGTICLVDTEPRTFDADQEQLLDELALWVERELKDNVDRDHAGHVQRSLLPAGPNTGADAEVAGVSIPFHHVGGDFHSWSRTGSVVNIVLADVMGKGVGAAIVAATVRATIKALGDGAPTDILRRTNELLLDDFTATSTFATVFLARLDLVTGELEFADAGHGLSVLVRPDGSHQRLISTGLPLGIAVDAEFHAGQATLEHGDTLVTFTDGLLDLLDGTLASIDPIVDIALGSKGAVEIVGRITALCRTLRATDDVTVVAVTRPSLI
jgi:sigma-B regulation protein RsbU (phosphoserine phosphatase)